MQLKCSLVVRKNYKYSECRFWIHFENTRMCLVRLPLEYCKKSHRGAYLLFVREFWENSKVFFFHFDSLSNYIFSKTVRIYSVYNIKWCLIGSLKKLPGCHRIIPSPIILDVWNTVKMIRNYFASPGVKHEHWKYKTLALCWVYVGPPSLSQH